MNIQGPWYSNIAVSEKLDGLPRKITLGQYGPYEEGKVFPAGVNVINRGPDIEYKMPYSIIVNARDTETDELLTPDKDSFAAWVQANAEDLFDFLGRGFFEGVWWGKDIGRGYGQDEQFFSFLDLKGYAADAPTARDHVVDGLIHAPVLYQGPFAPENGQDPVAEVLKRLQFSGSAAVPGFKNPAGVVVTNLDTGLHFDVSL